MGLFGKKKESPAPQSQQAVNARILVLGSGCANCQKLEENTREALRTLGMQQEVGHVQDMAQIAAYGVMSTPALVIDRQVVSVGRVLTAQEAAQLIQQHFKPQP